MKKRNIGVLIAGLFLAISMVGSVSCSCSSEPDGPPPVEEHVHTKSDWKSDETHHWHTCSGCDEILDKEAHTFSEWTVTKEATCTAKGERFKTCTVCNYVVKEEIPKLDHKVSEVWTSDETSHWHICETCEEKIEKADHTFGEWVVTKEATCTEKGERTKTCTVCNYEVKEEIPQLEHSYGEWVVEEEPTCSKVGKKTKTCSVCGHKVSEEIPIDETAHELGSYEITVEPTKTTEGEVQIKCKHDETHIQKVVLPVLASSYYQYRVVDKDELNKEEYFIFNPNFKEEILALFAGTLLEGTQELENLIAHRSFARNTFCKHKDLSASYEVIPSNTADGRIKFECLNCQKSVMVRLEPSSIKDYYFVPSLTEEDKGTYNLTLSAASRIFDRSDLSTEFQGRKVDVVKALKGATFTASAYNLSIELNHQLENPSDTLALKVFTPRNLSKPQFDLVETDLAKTNTDWFEYRFTTSDDCSTSVIKTLHIKESKVAEFATTYLDPNCGTISTHPETETLLSNLVLATDTPTLQEQNAHSKHSFGNMALIRKPEAGPSGRTGLVRILCSRYSQDAFQYDLEVPQYTDTTFYDSVETAYSTTYIVKESALKSTVNNELKEYFNFTMDAKLVARFKDIIKVIVNKNVTAEIETPISDTKKQFTIGFFVNGYYEESIQSTFSIDDKTYFTITYEEKNCDEFNAVYTLNARGRNLYLENTGLENNPDIIDFLTNLRVGSRRAPDNEIHNRKTLHHEFVYVSHSTGSAGSTRDGALKAKCSSCQTIFTVPVCKNDIYTVGSDGQQEIDRERLENRIQAVYPAFTLTEVRAFADVFILGGYL